MKRGYAERAFRLCFRKGEPYLQSKYTGERRKTISNRFSEACNWNKEKWSEAAPSAHFDYISGSLESHSTKRKDRPCGGLDSEVTGGSLKRSCAALPPLSKLTSSAGRNRTCDFCVPNKSAPIFSLIYKAFRGFWVRKRCFRVLLQALFPRSPTP